MGISRLALVLAIRCDAHAPASAADAGSEFAIPNWRHSSSDEHPRLAYSDRRNPRYGPWGHGNGKPAFLGVVSRCNSWNCARFRGASDCHVGPRHVWCLAYAKAQSWTDCGDFICWRDTATDELGRHLFGSPVQCPGDDGIFSRHKRSVDSGPMYSAPRHLRASMC